MNGVGKEEKEDRKRAAVQSGSRHWTWKTSQVKGGGWRCNDKYSTYPSNGLTPRRLARIFRAADEGDVSEQMELFEEMEEKDTHLFSQLQTRKLAVTGLDWEVQSFSDDERDKEIAEFIDEQLKGIENLDDILLICSMPLVKA